MHGSYHCSLVYTFGGAHERVYGPRDYVQVTRQRFIFLAWAMGPAKLVPLHSDWATSQATSAFGGKFDIPIPHDELEGKPLLGV